MNNAAQRTGVRPAAVAGMFYPDDPAELRDLVGACLNDARGSSPGPKAIIAPHAGFIFSGPVAGSAYATLAPLRDTIRRVVLAGPSHRVAFRGLAVSGARSFETPLGEVAVDDGLRRRVLEFPFVKEFEPAHAVEHSLETHLPFLQSVLAQFTILPLVAGDVSPDDVAAALDAVWGGPETLIDISSDLSHYHRYEEARHIDGETAKAIERLDGAPIEPDRACGCLAVKGLLLCAKRRGLRAITLDLRNSGDTAGPRDQVVGYGAYAFA